MMAAIFMAMNLGSRSLLQEAAMTHTEVMETIKTMMGGINQVFIKNTLRVG